MTSQIELGLKIKELRESRGMTQLELASILNLSDRTISKWETGRGYPDITFLEKITAVFSLSIGELLSASQVRNSNISANILKTSFYVCPLCGNVIVSTGEASISCHGIMLSKLVKNEMYENHSASADCA